MEGFIENVKPFLMEMLGKHGLNTEMWKRELNNQDDDNRTITLSLESPNGRHRMNISMKFIITELDVDMNDEMKERVLEMIAEGHFGDL